MAGTGSDLAARRLLDGDDSLETIAHAVGYTSVYAFSRAFSRARAMPRGQYRARTRQSVRRGGPPSARP